MPTPVRYPSGVTNVGANDALRNMPEPDPTKTIMFWDDFFTYTAANWTVTETAAGATQAINTGARGGILELTGTAGGGATDVTQIQLINETFKCTSGKQLWIKARFAATATLANFGILVGLAITDTSAVAGVSDGIYFRKATGAATLEAVIEKDSTESTSGTIATMVSGTYVECALYYNGKNAVEVYYNGNKVYTFTTLTNLCQDEELAVTLASVNATAAAANVLSVDYIMVAEER